jgi:hypothetical protein
MKQSAELAEQFQDALATLLGQQAYDLLSRYGDREGEDREVTQAISHEEHGTLTLDQGLVVTLSDGSEINLNITAYAPRG